METKTPFLLLFICAVFGGIFVDMQVGNIFAEEPEGMSIPYFTICFIVGTFLMYKSVFNTSVDDDQEE